MAFGPREHMELDHRPNQRHFIFLFVFSGAALSRHVSSGFLFRNQFNRMVALG
jgi:hypothetical protein